LPKIIKCVALHDLPVIVGKLPSEEKDNKSLEETVVPEDWRQWEQEAKAAREQAEERLAQARQQADALLAETRLTAEQLRQTAREEGMQSGHQQGYQQGLEEGKTAAAQLMQEQVQAAAAKAEHMVQLAEQERINAVLAAERQIVEVTVTVLRKVLAREIEENPMVVLPIVKAALEKVCDQEQVTVRIHPEDYDLVLQARRDLQAMLGREQALTVLADHTVSVGGCVVDTPCGTVDARIDAQLEALIKVLQDVCP